jgi:hypothetical protein
MIVPADSRSATWRCNSAAKYSSCDQFSSRACPASSSQQRPIVGVLSTRVRYASIEGSPSAGAAITAGLCLVVLIHGSFLLSQR